ncbi:MMPL family transporter, partial [Pontibacterium sp.]
MNSRTYTVFGFLLRHPWLILTALITLLIFLLFQLPRLTLDASADSLVLEGDKALELYRDMGKRYQSNSYLVVTYTPNESLFAPHVLNRLAQLRDELKKIPDVESVITILDVPLLYSPPVRLGNLSSDIRYLQDDETSTDLARQEFRNSPLYKQLLTSPDERTTVLQINLKRDERFFQLLEARDLLRSKRLQQKLSPIEVKQLSEAEHAFRSHSIQTNERQRELVDQTRKVLDRHRDHATIFLGGVPMIAVDMIAFIESDLFTFGSAIVLFIIALMVLIFRRLRWMVLPLLTCVVTCLIMLGFIAFVDWQLTVISSNFTALLLIITLAITIHLVVRYREYYRAQPSFSQRQLVLST